jgi:hypothetical protein
MSATNLASQAMRSLVGHDFQHMIANTDYDKFIVVGAEKPSKEAFEAKFQELIDAQPLKELREERNKRLADVDWVFSEDYSIEDDSYKQWLTYRKALRDLPSATEDPENPVWPEQPAMPSGTTENKDLTRELRIENNRLKSKVTILENRQTHFNTLLVNLIGRVETLERPA